MGRFANYALQFLRLLAEDESEPSSSGESRRMMESAESSDGVGTLRRHEGMEVLSFPNFAFLLV